MQIALLLRCEVPDWSTLTLFLINRLTLSPLRAKLRQSCEQSSCGRPPGRTRRAGRASQLHFKQIWSASRRKRRVGGPSVPPASWMTLISDRAGWDKGRGACAAAARRWRALFFSSFHEQQQTTSFFFITSFRAFNAISRCGRTHHMSGEGFQPPAPPGFQQTTPTAAPGLSTGVFVPNLPNSNGFRNEGLWLDQMGSDAATPTLRVPRAFFRVPLCARCSYCWCGCRR